MLRREKEGALASPKFIEPSENKGYSFPGAQSLVYLGDTASIIRV